MPDTLPRDPHRAADADPFLASGMLECSECSPIGYGYYSSTVSNKNDKNLYLSIPSIPLTQSVPS